MTTELPVARPDANFNVTRPIALLKEGAFENGQVDPDANRIPVLHHNLNLVGVHVAECLA